MKKEFLCFLITAALSMFTFSSANASHLAGQDFTYIFVDSAMGVYHYRVSLSIFQDCFNGTWESITQDTPAYLAVYNGLDSLIQVDSVSHLSDDSLPITSSGCDDNFPAFLCRRKVTFTKDYYLPPSVSGYTIVYQRCCLNYVSNVIASGNDGMTALCSIPPSGVTTHNNSAVFSNYPPFIIDLNKPISFDCSATDADGDSLSYGFYPSLNCCDTSLNANIKPWPPSPPPFAEVNYITPLSYSNPMSCSATLTLNPISGMLNGTPNTPGTYLITAGCNEWRSGVLINTVRREFEFAVANCALDIPSIRTDAYEMYPNPTSNTLTIQTANSITNLTIANLLGQTIFTNNYHSETIQVDVSTLPPGVYFVKINGTEVRKFVKE